MQIRVATTAQIGRAAEYVGCELAIARAFRGDVVVRWCDFDSAMGSTDRKYDGQPSASFERREG
jgi:hypothetical protein